MKLKFEHSALERDIQRLSQEIREHKVKAPVASERDLVKSLLQSRIQSAAPISPASEDDQSSILPAYLQKESPEIKLKVEELIDLTFHKGIEVSLKEAKKYGSFILDALHHS